MFLLGFVLFEFNAVEECDLRWGGRSADRLRLNSTQPASRASRHARHARRPMLEPALQHAASRYASCGRREQADSALDCALSL